MCWSKWEQRRTDEKREQEVRRLEAEAERRAAQLVKETKADEEERELIRA